MEGTVTSSTNFYNATPSLDSGGDANAALAGKTFKKID